MEIQDVEILKKIENQKDRAYNAILEKNEFLGIYKERVILALTKEEVEEKFIYKEVRRALENPLASKLILSRAVELKNLKKYMAIAEKMEINCKLVDGLSYVGEVGLVVASKDAIKPPISNPFVLPRKLRIKKAGLPFAYYEAIGKKISQKYMNVIKILMPDMVDEYQLLTFKDKLFGGRCPLEEKLGGKIYG